MGVEFWPLNLLICATTTTYDWIDRIERREEERKKKRKEVQTRGVIVVGGEGGGEKHALLS